MLVCSKQRWPRLCLGLSALVCILALGCQQAEQIQTKVVPKEPKAEVVADAKPGEPTDRMLAAILPIGDQAWFFKVVGPIPEIGPHEQEIRDFFAGLGIGSDGRASWKVPAGWKEEAGNPMCAATIVIPGDKRLEITVNALPWKDRQNDLLPNVNRWRGQLQLPAIGCATTGRRITRSESGRAADYDRRYAGPIQSGRHGRGRHVSAVCRRGSRSAGDRQSNDRFGASGRASAHRCK